MVDSKFLEFDTWLLRSIMLAKVDGSATVERILGAADLMSKTPMTASDLRYGLIRLAQNGWIEEREGAYSPTAAVPAALKWSDKEKVRQLLAEPKPETEKSTDSGNLTKIAGGYVKRFQGFVSGLTNPKKE
jgi:hypothetical protein